TARRRASRRESVIEAERAWSSLVKPTDSTLLFYACWLVAQLVVGAIGDARSLVLPYLMAARSDASDGAWAIPCRSTMIEPSTRVMRPAGSRARRATPRSEGSGRP